MIFRISKLNHIYWKLVVSVLILLILIPIGFFLFDEWHRQRLLERYEQVAARMKLSSQTSFWRIESLLQPNETIVCVMDSYGRTEDFPELTNRQKLSAPKSKLPSESGLWYMLFFSTGRVERISIWQYTGTQFDSIRQSCGDSSARFLVSPDNLSDEKSGLGILSINK